MSKLTGHYKCTKLGRKSYKNKVTEKVTETLEFVNLKAGKPKKPEDGSNLEHEQEDDLHNISGNEDSEEEPENTNRVAEFTEDESNILTDLETGIADQEKTSDNNTTKSGIFPEIIPPRQPEDIQHEALRKDDAETETELARVEQEM